MVALSCTNTVPSFTPVWRGWSYAATCRIHSWTRSISSELDAVIGEDTQGRMLYVVHIQQEGDRFRVISARKVTPAERRRYESQ